MEELKSNEQKEILKEEIEKIKTKLNKLEKIKKNKIIAVILGGLYSIAVCLILMLYIYCFIDKIQMVSYTQKAIYIVEIYIGVITLSVLGAYLSPIISKNIKLKINNRVLELSSKILEKERNIEMINQKIKDIERENQKENINLEKSSNIEINKHIKYKSFPLKRVKRKK